MRASGPSVYFKKLLLQGAQTGGGTSIIVGGREAPRISGSNLYRWVKIDGATPKGSLREPL